VRIRSDPQRLFRYIDPFNRCADRDPWALRLESAVCVEDGQMVNSGSRLNSDVYTLVSLVRNIEADRNDEKQDSSKEKGIFHIDRHTLSLYRTKCCVPKRGVTLVMMRIDFISDINRGYEAAFNYEATDRFILKVLWGHFAVFSLLAFTNSIIKLASFYPSPLAWRVVSIPEAVATVLIALAVTLVPAFLAGTIQNHYLWRLTVTVALSIYSYLFVFISGGSIEMHFHFFIIIALLMVFADWRLGWVVAGVTVLHHGILNYIEPGWVYFYGRNDFSVIAHSVPILVAAVFATVLCEIARKSIVSLRTAQKGLEERTAELEKVKRDLEVAIAGKNTEVIGVKEENEALKGQLRSA